MTTITTLIIACCLSTAQITLTAATIYDIESTYYALAHCEQCYESNPVQRQLFKSSRPIVYAANLALNSTLLFLPKDAQPIAQYILAASHLLAGTLNLRFVF